MTVAHKVYRYSIDLIYPITLEYLHHQLKYDEILKYFDIVDHRLL